MDLDDAFQSIVDETVKYATLAFLHWARKDFRPDTVAAGQAVYKILSLVKISEQMRHRQVRCGKLADLEVELSVAVWKRYISPSVGWPDSFLPPLDFLLS